MINLINATLMALIAVIMGIMGAYFTKWEKDIYQKYFQYILPPVLMAAVFFMFIDQMTSQSLFFVFIIGISWAYTTKFWFNKNK